MAKSSPEKSQQKAQAAERQHRGELVRKVLDTWVEIQRANGDREPHDGPLLAIDEWPHWTHNLRSWQDFREALLDCADSNADQELLEALFPATGPDRVSIEILKLADQLVYNQQLAAAAARWREIEPVLRNKNG